MKKKTSLFMGTSLEAYMYSMYRYMDYEDLYM